MLYLGREERELWGHCVISLGSEFEGEDDQLIYYST